MLVAVQIAVAAAALALATGCGVQASSALGSARRPASPTNRGLSSAVSECLRLKQPASGVAAYMSDGARLPFAVFAGHEPGTQPRCAADELRVLALQSLVVGGRLTYVRRGGCQTPCVVRQATVHVPASAFSSPIDPLPVAARNGDGAPAAGCRESVDDAPQLAGSELARMFYKRPPGTPSGRAISPDVGARWSNYGDPGRLYGGKGKPAANYTYLLWNLPRTPVGVLHGGGIVEAVIGQGQPVELCAGPRLELPGFDVDGRLDGSVEFAYAELRPAPSEPIYGWVLLGYDYRGRHQRLTT